MRKPTRILGSISKTQSKLAVAHLPNCLQFSLCILCGRRPRILNLLSMLHAVEGRKSILGIDILGK